MSCRTHLNDRRYAIIFSLYFLFQKFQVEERNITIDELLGADEVFCTGTAVVLLPVGSITYRERK